MPSPKPVAVRMPKKVKAAAKLKGPAPIVAGSNADRFRPGTPVAMLMHRDAEVFWVSGYEIWNPLVTHRVTSKKGGEVPLIPKGATHGMLRVIRSGQVGKTQRVIYSEVLPLTELVSLGLSAVTFGSLYGGHDSRPIASERTFEGFTYDAPDESLDERGLRYVAPIDVDDFAPDRR